MLDQILEAFVVVPDVDLALMEPNQTLAGLTFSRYRLYLAKYQILQGDTTTVFCAAIAAFYRKIPVGHVEQVLPLS